MPAALATLVRLPGFQQRRKTVRGLNAFRRFRGIVITGLVLL